MNRSFLRAGRSLAALLLVVSMLAPLLFMSAPVSAGDGVMNLTIGGSGSAPWTIANIVPGDNGTELVELRNAGRIDGYVTIWFSDVVETDGGTDGRHLAEHFLLAPSSVNMSSNISFPAPFTDMPRTSLDRSICIGPLKAGETINLTWAWEFFDSGAPQNEAQGDGLSFTINYLMTATGPEDGVSWLVIDVLGTLTVVALNATGYVQEAFQATNANGTVVLEFAAGTQILTENGTVPEWLVVTEAEQEDVLNGTNATALSPTYVISAFDQNNVSTNVSFSSGASLIIGFDPEALPEGFVPGLYQLVDGVWVRLNETGPFYSWYAYADIIGTGSYAAGAYDDRDEYALLEISELTFKGTKKVFWWNVLPLFIKYNYKASVSLNVSNVGNAPGNFTINIVLDDRVVDTVDVYLEAGESEQLTFQFNGVHKGQHHVTVGSLEEQFKTYTWINWPLIWAIIAITLLIILVAYGIRRRQESN
ncbi:MAG TPA: hypothetical protein PLC39_03300 [Methanomassiliicoccales archaeon]|nr:hypothetical protein [Methanomassiliicoccales archaeon]HNX48100.1 hypothetical protein [Methanomassiliicoccales archaeon]HPR98306.1 hypothetical protein [Methanomassiliicoccales archaeon]